MASKQQAIQQAVQAAAELGAVQGYVQALEDVNGNLVKQQQAYGEIIAQGGETPAADERFDLLCGIGVEIDKQLEARRTLVQPALAKANSLLTAAAIGPGTRARWWLARVLGGAAQRLSRP